MPAPILMLPHKSSSPAQTGTIATPWTQPLSHITHSGQTFLSTNQPAPPGPNPCPGCTPLHRAHTSQLRHRCASTRDSQNPLQAPTAVPGNSLKHNCQCMPAAHLSSTPTQSASNKQRAPSPSLHAHHKSTTATCLHSLVSTAA